MSQNIRRSNNALDKPKLSPIPEEKSVQSEADQFAQQALTKEADAAKMAGIFKNGSMTHHKDGTRRNSK
jgi:hypothetical protein